jgi:hypothetical protein
MCFIFFWWATFIFLYLVVALMIIRRDNHRVDGCDHSMY